jgi:hypothetical protein
MEGKGTRVESEDDPAVGEMEVDGFYSGRSLQHLLLDLQSQGHIKYLITLGIPSPHYNKQTSS